MLLEKNFCTMKKIAKQFLHGFYRLFMCLNWETLPPLSKWFFTSPHFYLKLLEEVTKSLESWVSSLETELISYQNNILVAYLTRAQI